MVVRDYNPALRAAIKAAAGIKGISNKRRTLARN